MGIIYLDVDPYMYIFIGMESSFKKGAKYLCKEISKKNYLYHEASFDGVEILCSTLVFSLSETSLDENCLDCFKIIQIRIQSWSFLTIEATDVQFFKNKLSYSFLVWAENSKNVKMVILGQKLTKLETLSDLLAIYVCSNT